MMMHPPHPPIPHPNTFTSPVPLKPPGRFAHLKWWILDPFGLWRKLSAWSQHHPKACFAWSCLPSLYTALIMLLEQFGMDFDPFMFPFAHKISGIPILNGIYVLLVFHFWLLSPWFFLMVNIFSFKANRSVGLKLMNILNGLWLLWVLLQIAAIVIFAIIGFGPSARSSYY